MFVFVPVVPNVSGLYYAPSPWIFVLDVIMLIIYMYLLCSFMKK